MSQSVALERQLSTIAALQGTYQPPSQNADGSFTLTPPVGATANGNGRIFRSGGYNGALLVQVLEQGGGTATLSLQGSLTAFLDNAAVTDQVALGYTTLSAGTRATSVSTIAVTALMRATFLVVDPYPFMRGVLSAVAGGAKVSVLLYAVSA